MAFTLDGHMVFGHIWSHLEFMGKTLSVIQLYDVSFTIRYTMIHSLYKEKMIKNILWKLLSNTVSHADFRKSNGLSALNIFG